MENIVNYLRNKLKAYNNQREIGSGTKRSKIAGMRISHGPNMPQSMAQESLQTGPQSSIAKIIRITKISKKNSQINMVAPTKAPATRGRHPLKLIKTISVLILPAAAQ